MLQVKLFSLFRRDVPSLFTLSLRSLHTPGSNYYISPCFLHLSRNIPVLSICSPQIQFFNVLTFFVMIFYLFQVFHLPTSLRSLKIKLYESARHDKIPRACFSFTASHCTLLNYINTVPYERCLKSICITCNLLPERTKCSWYNTYVIESHEL